MSKSQWTTSNIPDMSGKVVIVTGGNSGLGLETVRQLAKKGASTIMAARSEEKGKTAIASLMAELPNAKIELMLLDLANLASIKSFVDTFKVKYDQLHLLINNAGVMALPTRHETADGFEMQFGTNHLGHFALTGQLLDLIESTDGGRVVNVSSMAHRRGKVDFANINSEKRYNAWEAYGLSKISNLYFTYEMQRKLDKAGKKTRVLAAHPGWTQTNLQKHSGFANFLNPFLAQKVDMGTLPQLMAAVQPDIKGGEYYGPKGFMEMKGYPVQVDSIPSTKDIGIAARLWDESEKMTGIKYNL
jgi:NAD(P)-dependent dehydrogenase (short-subunit alcohol dehydrogenase family)